MRGGPALIHIEATYIPVDEPDTDPFSSMGVSVLPDSALTDELIAKHISLALANAEKNLQLTLAKEAVQLSSKDMEAFLKLLKRRTEEIKPKLLAKNPNEDLDGEPTLAHFQAVEGLCDTLGMTRISIKDCTVLEACAIIQELQYLIQEIAKVGE